jgi:hypothetical protein
MPAASELEGPLCDGFCSYPCLCWPPVRLLCQPHRAGGGLGWCQLAAARPISQLDSAWRIMLGSMGNNRGAPLESTTNSSFLGTGESRKPSVGWLRALQTPSLLIAGSQAQLWRSLCMLMYTIEHSGCSQPCTSAKTGIPARCSHRELSSRPRAARGTPSALPPLPFGMA